MQNLDSRPMTGCPSPCPYTPRGQDGSSLVTVSSHKKTPPPMAKRMHTHTQQIKQLGNTLMRLNFPSFAPSQHSVPPPSDTFVQTVELVGEMSQPEFRSHTRRTRGLRGLINVRSGRGHWQGPRVWGPPCNGMCEHGTQQTPSPRVAMPTCPKIGQQKMTVTMLPSICSAYISNETQK